MDARFLFSVVIGVILARVKSVTESALVGAARSVAMTNVSGVRVRRACMPPVRTRATTTAYRRAAGKKTCRPIAEGFDWQPRQAQITSICVGRHMV